MSGESMAVTLDITLPFYGDVGYLKATVNSVIAQTDPRWRLVVVDDGYPDPEVARWFATLGDERITYLRNDENLGANLNFAKCLTLVDSDYFMVMGADDLLHPTFVAHILHVLDHHPEIRIIQPGVEVIDETGAVVLPLADRIKRRLRPGPGYHHGQAAVASLMRGNWTYFPSLVWCTDAVRAHGFRDGLHVSQDLALIVDVIKSGGELLVLDQVEFQYRRHIHSDSSVKALTGARFAEESAVMRDLAREFSQMGWSTAARAARLRPTSRLNALSLVPRAVAKGRNPLPLLRQALG